MSRASTFYKILEAQQEEATVNLMWRNIEARRSPGPSSQTRPESVKAKNEHSNDTGIETFPARKVKQTHQSHDSRAPAWKRIGTIAAAALCIAGCVFSIYLIRSHSSNGQILSSTPAMFDNNSVKNETRFDFSDGSVVVATADTQFDVLVNQDDAIEFALRKGKMKFMVRPGGNRRWRVHCGNVNVSVVGTIFVVSKTPEDVYVSVERGTVLVSGARVPDGVQKLTATMHIRVPLAAGSPKNNPDRRSIPLSRKTVAAPMEIILSQKKEPMGAADTSPAGDAAAGSHQYGLSQHTRTNQAASNSHQKMSRTAVTPLKSKYDTDTQEATPPAPNSTHPWKRFVESGNFDDAYRALPAFTFSTLNTVEWSAADLFLLSDVARATRHPVDACNALQEIIRRYPNGPEGGLAAYSLAGITTDTLHQPENGAKQYERALELILPRTLRETSLFKLIQMHEKQSPQKALYFSDIYLREYPQGKYSSQITELRSRIEP